MEGSRIGSNFSAFQFAVIGLLLYSNIFGYASARAYASFGSYGTAFASSSASASASSFSTGNSGQGASISSGDQGASGAFSGNPFLSNAAKGGSYEDNIRGVTDGIIRVQEGIAGVAAGVLDNINLMNDNANADSRGPKGQSQSNCQSGNCGYSSFAYSTHYAGAYAFNETKVFYDNGNRNRFPEYNNDNGNEYLRPTFRENDNNKNAKKGIFPTNVVPSQNYPNFSINPSSVHRSPCNGASCTDNIDNIHSNQPDKNTLPSNIKLVYKVRNYSTSPTNIVPPICEGPACTESNNKNALQPNRANSQSDIIETHHIHNSPNSPTKISPTYLQPCNGPACNIFIQKSIQTGKKPHSQNYIQFYWSKVKKHLAPTKSYKIVHAKRSKRHAISHNPRSYPPLIYEYENERPTSYSASPYPLPYNEKGSIDGSQIQPARSTSHELPLDYVSSVDKSSVKTPISNDYSHETTSEIPSYAHHLSHHGETHDQITSPHASAAHSEPCNGYACHQTNRNENPIESETLEHSSINQGTPHRNTSSFITNSRNSACHGPHCRENEAQSQFDGQNSDEYSNPNHQIYSSDCNNPGCEKYEEYNSQREEASKNQQRSFSSTTVHQKSCNGPDCRENYRNRNPYEPNNSPNYSEQIHNSSTRSQNNEESYYPPLSPTSQHPACDGPDCEENHKAKDHLRLGTSNNPTRSIRNYDIPYHRRNSSSNYSPCHGPDCEGNSRDRKFYNPEYSSNHDHPNYSQSHSEKYYPRHHPTSRRPPCNGPACAENDSDKNPLELGTSNNPPGSIQNYDIPHHRNPSSHPAPSHHSPCHDPDCRVETSDQKFYKPEFPPHQDYPNYSQSHSEKYYPGHQPTTRRPPCNGPACEENDSDKNPLELGTSDNPPGSIYEGVGFNFGKGKHGTGSFYHDAQDQSRANTNDRFPFDPYYESSHEKRVYHRPNHSGNDEERYYSSNHKPPYRPPCYGPSCRGHGNSENPSLSPKHKEPHYPYNPSEGSSSHDPECHENNSNNNPLDLGTTSYSPQHPASGGSPLCNGPNCSGRGLDRNPFLSGANYHPSGTNPQNGPGDWHPVFNPNLSACTGPQCPGNKPPSTGCSGPHCGAGSYRNHPDLPPAYNNQAHPKTDCFLPDCNPYSTTGCPGPYCNSPEYANPGCSGGNCAGRHGPTPTCSGPGCGRNTFSTTGCTGPNCNGVDYPRPCTGSECRGQQHSNSEADACVGPHCGANYQPNPAYQSTRVIQVTPQNPSRPDCTNGNCTPNRPYSGPKKPIVFPQDSSGINVWPAIQKPNFQLIKQTSLNGGNAQQHGCNTGTCSNGSPSSTGSLSSSGASTSSSANAGSGGYGSGGGRGGGGFGASPDLYGNTFSNSFASASARASAYSGSYGR